MAQIAGKLGGKVLGDIFSAGSRRNALDAMNKTPYNGFNAGGLESFLGKGGSIGVRSSEERQGYVKSIADIFADEGADIRNNLLPQVTPGFGRLTNLIREP